MSLSGCGDGDLFPFRSLEKHAVDSSSSDSESSTLDLDSGSAAKDSDSTLGQQSAEVEIHYAEAAFHHGVGVQAEDYDANDAKESRRAWYLITADSTPDLVDPDDNSHAETAHGGAYMEVLPDLLTVSGDPNDDGFAMAEDPVEGAELGYRVTLEATGRYYVWVRGYTTGGKDNTLSVGIDGTWPKSGKNLQFPANSKAWVWSSNQRDFGGEVYGIPLTIYLDVETDGEHLIAFAMREDGFEIDEWYMTTDPYWVP